MELREWFTTWYVAICKEFSYDPLKDYKSALLLDNLIRKKFLRIEVLVKKFSNYRCAVIFGAGPSLKQDLNSFLKTCLPSRVLTISADIATSELISNGLLPHIIVTDLDGNNYDIVYASKKGSIPVVHAHGDNMEKIKKWVPRIKTGILGTTQSYPTARTYNFGGFTDGDRCVFIAERILRNKTIVLAGMDFGGHVGLHSTEKQEPMRIKVKIKKFKIAKQLLEKFAKETNSYLYNVTAKGEEIGGFIRTNFNRIESILNSNHYL